MDLEGTSVTTIGLPSLTPKRNGVTTVTHRRGDSSTWTPPVTCRPRGVEEGPGDSFSVVLDRRPSTTSSCLTLTTRAVTTTLRLSTVRPEPPGSTVTGPWVRGVTVVDPLVRPTTGSYGDTPTSLMTSSKVNPSFPLGTDHVSDFDPPEPTKLGDDHSARETKELQRPLPVSHLSFI